MDKKSLFALKKKHIKEFDKISDLRLFLKNLLGERLILPVVVGEYDLKIINLNPLTKTTELTVRNYLEGLKNLEQSKVTEMFCYGAVYQGITSLHYSNLDSHILRGYVIEKGRLQHPQTFNLDFYYSQTRHTSSKDEKTGYETVSNMSKTMLDEICARFVGPNIEYKK